MTGLVPHALALAERPLGWLQRLRELRLSARHYRAAKVAKAKRSEAKQRLTKKEKVDEKFRIAIAAARTAAASATDKP